MLKGERSKGHLSWCQSNSKEFLIISAQNPLVPSCCPWDTVRVLERPGWRMNSGFKKPGMNRGLWPEIRLWLRILTRNYDHQKIREILYTCFTMTFLWNYLFLKDPRFSFPEAIFLLVWKCSISRFSHNTKEPYTLSSVSYHPQRRHICTHMQ